jgi:hypothetical protein
MNSIDEKLDLVHSILIRLINSDENGNCYCYTCGTRLTFKTAQCGHYPEIPRENTKFRWNLIIHKVQGSCCNEYIYGLAEPYRDRLLSEIGIEKLSRYEIESKKPFKWFKSDKAQLLKEYRAKCRELLKDKNFTIQIP